MKQYSYMSINVDGNSIGTLSSITANGVSMEYISGSTLPFVLVALHLIELIKSEPLT
ncbi:MAG: hypothetical protein WDM78_11655 [Puia sp.]